MSMGNGVVFAVAGSKGGVGKTTTSINLSAVLGEMGYRVVLVEMDLAMANVGDFLDIDVGLEGEDPTLHEVLAGTTTVVDATYDSPCAFDVVPSGALLRGFRDAEVGQLSNALATLRFAYEVVIIDTGAGVAPEMLAPVALADETILVSSPRVASVRDTMKTRDLTRQVGGSVAGVVFVRSGTGRSPGVDHIAEFLSVDLLGHIPEDSAVADAQDTGLPVVVAESGSDAAAAYRDLGDRVSALVDGYGRPKHGVLSTDGTDGDDSGFNFIDGADSADDATETDAADSADDATETDAADSADDATETDAAEGTAESGTTPTTSRQQSANGRADGGRRRSSAAIRSAEEPPDAGDVDVAEAVRHVDVAGSDSDNGDTADGTGSEPRADTRSGRGAAVDEDESVGDVDSEDPTVARAGGDADEPVGNVDVEDDAATPVEDEGETVSDEEDDADPVKKNQPTGDSTPVEEAQPADDTNPVEEAQPADDTNPIEEAQPADDTDSAGRTLVDAPDTGLERDGVAEEGAPISDGETGPAGSPNDEAETTDVVRDDEAETTDVGRGADADDADAGTDGATETVAVGDDEDGTRDRSDGTDREFTESASESETESESEMESESETEATRSAAKRFIHRAVGIVGREDD